MKWIIYSQGTQQVLCSKGNRLEMFKRLVPCRPVKTTLETKVEVQIQMTQGKVILADNQFRTKKKLCNLDHSREMRDPPQFLHIGELVVQGRTECNSKVLASKEQCHLEARNTTRNQ